MTHMSSFPKNRLFLPVLAGLLVLGMAACGKQQNSDGGGNGDPDTGSDSELVYVPEFLDLEGGENINWSDTHIVGDDLYYMSYNWDMEWKTLISMSLNRYSILEGTTVEMALPLPEGAGLTEWAIGEDGSLYAILIIVNWDEAAGVARSDYMLAKYDTQGKELFVRDFTDLLGSDSYLGGIAVDGLGRIYVADNATDPAIWIFDAEGNSDGRVRLNSFTEGMINSFCRGEDGRVYVAVSVSSGEGSSAALWAVDFEKKGMEDISSDFTDIKALCQNAEGNFVLHDGSVVYVYDVNSRETEQLFSWLDCDMNGIYVAGFGELSDGRIAAAFRDWVIDDKGLAVIKRTSADRVIPKQEVVLGLMNHMDSDIEAAAVKFNKRNNLYHITLRYYTDQDSGSDTTASDALTRLNIDIVSDNCPDILSLDGIDVQQLAAKGVFEDLTPYLDQGGLSRSDLLENILEAYTFDNELISIPDSFMIRTTIGSKALVGEEMGWTLDEMIAFADAHPEAELFDRWSQENILKYCLTYNMDSFVDWERGNCHFDRDEFKSLLQFAARFPDRDSISYGESQLTTQERIHNGEVLLMNAQIYKLNAIQLYEGMFNGPVTCIGYPSTDGGSKNILLPYGTYAITSKSNVKEGAWAFLESYLTRENPSYQPGLPNSWSELERMAAEAVRVEYVLDENGEPVLDAQGNPVEKPQSYGGTGYGDWTYEYRVSTQEEVDTVFQLIKTARPNSDINEQIIAIIDEEAPAFFQGQKSVDDVAETIQRTASIYVSENS